MNNLKGNFRDEQQRKSSNKQMVDEYIKLLMGGKGLCKYMFTIVIRIERCIRNFGATLTLTTFGYCIKSFRTF